MNRFMSFRGAKRRGESVPLVFRMGVTDCHVSPMGFLAMTEKYQAAVKRQPPFL